MHELFRQIHQPPRFDLITPALTDEALGELLIEAEQAIDYLEKNAQPNWDSLFLGLHHALTPLFHTWGILNHELSVMNSQEWREVDDKYRSQLIAFGLKIGQNPIFYKLMEEMAQPESFSKLSAMRQRLLMKSLEAAKLNGIALPEKQQERFNEIQRNLGEISTKFSNNVLDAIKAFTMVLTQKDEVVGLPITSIQMAVSAAKSHGHPEATPENGPWIITLDGPSFMTFMKYAERRDLREKIYRAFITRASSGELDNGPLIDQILSLKYEMAQLLGYKNFAEISTSQKMAGSVDNAEKLIQDLIHSSLPKAKLEYKELCQFAKDHHCPYELMNWDVAYWEEKMRQEQYDFDEEELRPYFQFPKVLEGLFSLTHKLFDVTIIAADGEAPVWHPDTRYFKILDHSGKPIASFYLDPYSRPATKRGGAWMNTALGRERLEDNTIQNPIAYLICNQTPPNNGKPSLMSFMEVTTLFHEFGHGLQHMLTTIDEPDAAGINGIEWDAVELASQFMENWCFQKETLISMTCHVETGKSLPDELFDKLYRAKNFREAGRMLRQCHFASLDLALYAHYIPGQGKTVQDIVNEQNQKSTVMKPLPEDRFLCSFTHIFAGGYSAGYYSYKWSEVLSADAFSAFEEAGLTNTLATQETGKRYRQTILALGGSQHPLEVFKSFRGREPNTQALLRHSGLI